MRGKPAKLWLDSSVGARSIDRWEAFESNVTDSAMKASITQPPAPPNARATAPVLYVLLAPVLYYCSRRAITCTAAAVA